MFKEYFLLMVTGHVLADFYVQTAKVAKKKKDEWKWVAIHCIMYLLTVTVVSIPFFSIQILMLDVIISLCHATIDSCKFFYLKGREKSPSVFLVDQFLHLICLAVAAYIWTYNKILLQELTFIQEFFGIINISELSVCKWFLSLLIIWKPTNILIQKLIGNYKPKTGNNEINVDNNIGRKIGTTERILMLILLYVNQYSAIGLVLTAKSIARYDRITKDENFAEYYLLGTLISVGASVICAVLLF